LLCQLAGGDNNDDKRLGTDTVAVRIIGAALRNDRTGTLQLADLAHQLGDDRDEVGSSLAGAGLGDSNEIVSSQDDGNAVSLDDSDGLVSAELGIGDHLRMQAGSVEL
jgi:hypothetical protein